MHVSVHFHSHSIHFQLKRGTWQHRSSGPMRFIGNEQLEKRTGYHPQMTDFVLFISLLVSQQRHIHPNSNSLGNHETCWRCLSSNHNVMTIVMSLLAIALQLVNVWVVAVLNKQSWKKYRTHLRKLSPRRRYRSTRNTPTLLGYFWMVIRNSKHILGSLIDQLLTVSSISLHTRHR